MAGEAAATLKGQLSGVALGVICGGRAKAFQGFSKYVFLCLASFCLKELDWFCCCLQLNSAAAARGLYGPIILPPIPFQMRCPQSESLKMSRDEL